MKLFLVLALFCLGFFTTSCANTAQQVTDEAFEQRQIELGQKLREPTIRQLKYVVETDLQFDKGCRDQGIAIPECDFRNTLSVVFDEFDCKSRLNPDDPLDPLHGLNDGGVSCDYTGVINWPDGRTEWIEARNELYRLEYYSVSQSHEYRWRKFTE